MTGKKVSSAARKFLLERATALQSGKAKALYGAYRVHSRAS